MIPKNIHQIFFNIGKGELDSFPRYIESHQNVKLYCLNNDIKYKLWNRYEIDNLVNNSNKNIKDIYKNFRYDIQKIDFAKYLLIYNYGGIYIDLDINIIADIKCLFDKEYVFVRWNNSHLPYNAIVGGLSKSKLWKEIILECIRSTKEKDSMDIYKKWKGRYVYQTTGHYMIQRVLKREKISKKYLLNILDILSKGKRIIGKNVKFYDTNESVWYDKEYL